MSSESEGGVDWSPYEEGTAPWSEDEQFEEAAKACKSRCKEYGKSNCEGEFEGDCTECEHDAQVVLRKKYLKPKRPSACTHRHAQEPERGSVMSDLREALKPCPFCGGEPDIRTRQDEDIWTHNIVTWTGVHCAECGIGFDWPPGAEPTAVEQWNTRAALAAQPEAVEAVIHGAVANARKDAESQMTTFDNAIRQHVERRMKEQEKGE